MIHSWNGWLSFSTIKSRNNFDEIITKIGESVTLSLTDHNINCYKKCFSFLNLTLNLSYLSSILFLLSGFALIACKCYIVLYNKIQKTLMNVLHSNLVIRLTFKLKWKNKNTKSHNWFRLHQFANSVMKKKKNGRAPNVCSKMAYILFAKKTTSLLTSHPFWLSIRFYLFFDFSFYTLLGTIPPIDSTISNCKFLMQTIFYNKHRLINWKKKIQKILRERKNVEKKLEIFFGEKQNLLAKKEIFL